MSLNFRHFAAPPWNRAFHAACLSLSLALPLLSFGCGDEDGTMSAPSPKVANRVRVRFADARTLVVQIDPSEAENAATLYALRDTDLSRFPDWKRKFYMDFAMAKAVAGIRGNLRPLVVRLTPLSEPGGETQALQVVDGGGWWTNPNGQKRLYFPDGTVVPLRGAEVLCTAFFRLPEPLAPGRYRLTLPDGTAQTFDYAPAESVSPLFKTDQVGYLPDARKEILLGTWMGAGGPLPLFAYVGRPFRILRESDGSEAFTGMLAQSVDMEASSGVAVTGENTLVADFSVLREPGRYRCAVDGIGRSEVFTLRADALVDAFYIHMRGLANHRCGRVCHRAVFRGNFPPNPGHYTADPARSFGFSSADGKPLSVGTFALIRSQRGICTEKLLLPGGWHDAADYDRRNYHLRVVQELCMAYLMNPAAFFDGQLDLPGGESANGIPDILDEAIWGLEVWRRAQRPDGGVGCWVESVGHPTEPSDPAHDTMPYYLALPTRESSMEYAAVAATLTYALRQAGETSSGAASVSEVWAGSAKRAWAFAADSGNRARQDYVADGSDTSLPKAFHYEEAPVVSEDIRAAAVLAFYACRGDAAILDGLSDVEWARAWTLHVKRAWWHTPLRFGLLALLPKPLPNAAAERFRRSWESNLLLTADQTVARVNVNPYRNPWRSASEPMYETMAWGNGLPLNCARALVMAWRMTGRPEYREAALSAVNHANGLNALGLTFTSGLGICYPVRYLDLRPDKRSEYPVGVTPYRNICQVPTGVAQYAFGLVYSRRLDCGFAGLSACFLPGDHARDLDVQGIRRAAGKFWPVDRRWGNVEAYTVSSSEYSVWETISPSAFVTGVLMDPKAAKPSDAVRSRSPARDLRDLPGYWMLP